MKTSVLFTAFCFFTSAAYAGNCNIDVENIIEAIFSNAPPIIQAEFHTVEPDKNNPKGRIACPNLQPFVGEYRSTQRKQCADLKISIKPDKMSLAIDGHHDLNGINSGKYRMIPVGNNYFLELSTTIVANGNMIIEQAVSEEDGFIVGLFAIELVDNGLIVSRENEDSDSVEVCTYTRRK